LYISPFNNAKLRIWAFGYIYNCCHPDELTPCHHQMSLSLGVIFVLKSTINVATMGLLVMVYICFYDFTFNSYVYVVV
jgi:hypothetical protein